MTILIFILVLVVLIVVHELGHFVAAKLSGMRVDEFGIGYPPRALVLNRGKETVYTLNWLPFGGFVKIFGEDIEKESIAAPGSFSSKPRILQAITLFAGIAMNLVLAYVLISATLLIGTPRALEDGQIARATDVSLAVASVLPGSPAAQAGLQPGETLLSIESAGGKYTGTTPSEFTSFVARYEAGTPLTLQVRAVGGEERVVPIKADTGIVLSDPERPALGIGLAPVGVIKESLLTAPWEGLKLTGEIVKQTAVGLVLFFGSIFTLSADLSDVAGPVGIAGVVGNAANQGIVALLSITAIISINLAIINLLPVPALDGGRLLFVLIESITRKPIKPIVANTMNTVGFGLLVLLMVVVTVHDIFRIVG